MSKKYYLIFSFVLVTLLLLSTTIKATSEVFYNEVTDVNEIANVNETNEVSDTEAEDTADVEENEEVPDRHMAIASALSYVPLQKGKRMSEDFDINKLAKAKMVKETYTLRVGKKKDD